MQIAGGWLAMGWPDDRHPIGVQAPTRQEALDAYELRADWWRDFHKQMDQEAADAQGIVAVVR